ncbi:zinc finger BED domain-containing protein RICESLEEPER 2-like [Heracleum sosnowskyi]|uniref:Zinc finger BED domain-containing protein RICESLEEPER 2-like n=1 Tax=Heracleum sosnowskyi TaxID=360622 RepID=A0AAD8IZP7_9APIA|nr:zinc finger BED domain-containing protein RICESLEEPER 2-like [Heracleum sosnowskyi]
MDQFFTDATEMEDVVFSPPNPTPNATPNPTPNTIPNPTPNTAPNPTLDSTTPNPTPDTTPTELKSPKKEGDEQVTNKNKPTRTSDVWAHFKKVTSGDPNNPRCKCNYCGADYACHSTRVGTSSLWVHLRKCKKYPGRASDKKQKVLSFKKEIGGGSNLLAVPFNKVKCRNALAKFVVKDEQAFKVVEGDGFKDLVQELQLMFVIPSRVTIARDVHPLFCRERGKLMEQLTTTGQRVCLTTDCCTSRTQMAYMCLTAHYIDSDWKLQKKIINFCQISNHKGDTIGKAIETCLLSWGIEKVFTVTLDNASSNKEVVAFVRRRVNAWKGDVLGGENMHMKCGAHIVNLIVNDGLKEMHDSIAAIRNSVRYIRSSPARLQKFKICAEKEKIEYKGGLVLDVQTRWNSTYMMLDVAMKFEKAFTRYEEEDDKFVSYFMEKENGKKRMGPPIANDWHAASIFVKFLATFYEVTLKFSSTLHVTSNNFYHEICEVHTLLTDLAASRDPLLSSMAGSMKEKYDKYWGDVEDINPLLFLAVVLDPRYKMGYLKYCFESVYDAESVARIVTKVESLLQ